MVIAYLLIESMVVTELYLADVQVELIAVQVVSITVAGLEGDIAAVINRLHIIDVCAQFPEMIIDLLSALAQGDITDRRVDNAELGSAVDVAVIPGI